MLKTLPANAEDTGDVGSIPESGRSPGEGNSNLPQYPCLENSMDKAWQATVHGVENSQTPRNMSMKRGRRPFSIFLSTYLNSTGKYWNYMWKSSFMLGRSDLGAWAAWAASPGLFLPCDYKTWSLLSIKEGRWTAPGRNGRTSSVISVPTSAPSGKLTVHPFSGRKEKARGLLCSA